MKKLIYTMSMIAALMLSLNASAKKVKFAVDMTGQTVSVNGVHVSGDFQTLAGDTGGDWNPATTKLYQEGTSNIYSTVVNLPAFRKYEYKFVNGDQFYESEFVPEESRVGYNFNDNRWLYIDSLSDDTTFVGALLFSGNAPLGLKLLRFRVDLNGKNIASDGLHLSADYNQHRLDNIYMYQMDKKVCEVIQYLDSGKTYNYKYVNGESAAASELVPGACAQNQYRFVSLTKDTVLPVVCFNECAACNNVGIYETTNGSPISLFPNPSSGSSTLLMDQGIHNIDIYQISGQRLLIYPKYTSTNLDIHTLAAGIYMIRVETNGVTSHIKLVVQ